MTRSLETRKGAYVDSVTLMQVSKRVAALDGVSAALVAMATDLNLELAAQMGFEVPTGLSPNEMLVALDAGSPEVLDLARAEVDAALAASARPPTSGFGSAPSRAPSRRRPGTSTRRPRWRWCRPRGSTRSPMPSTRSTPA